MLYLDTSDSSDCEADCWNFLLMIFVVIGHFAVCNRSKVISSLTSTGLFSGGCRGMLHLSRTTVSAPASPDASPPKHKRSKLKAGLSLASLTRAVTVPHPCSFHLYSSPWCLELAVGKSDTVSTALMCHWEGLFVFYRIISVINRSEVVLLVMHSLLIKNEWLYIDAIFTLACD